MNCNSEVFLGKYWIIDYGVPIFIFGLFIIGVTYLLIKKSLEKK